MAQAVALIARNTAHNVAVIERTADPVAPAITTSALPNGRVGQAYAQTVQATGYPGPTAAITSGALPAGLSLNSVARQISGTPTTPVASAFDVTVTNSAGSDVESLAILVPNEGSGGDAPVVTTVTLVPAAADVLPGAAVDLLVTVEDQAGAPMANLTSVVTVANASATATQLAPTDAFGQATVRVTGVTAGLVGVYVTVDTVRSNTSDVTVLDAVPPTIETATLADAIIGQAYSVLLQAQGSPPLTWSLDSGALPAGFQLSGDGTIFGTAAAAETAVFTVKATNAYGTDTQALSIAVVPLVSITSVTVTPETVTIRPGAQTQLAAAVAGTGAFNPAVTWSVVSGGGSVSPAGLYTAPPIESVVVVRATSVQDATKYDEATITVEAAPAADTIHVPGIRFGKYAGSTLAVRTRITVASGSAEGLVVSAASSDSAKVSVMPASVAADVDGYATFLLSFLYGGEAVVTFASGDLSSKLLAITRTG